LDEAMVAFSGNHEWIQFQPLKPIKCGFKFYVLADAVNYFALTIKLHDTVRDPKNPPSNPLLSIVDELIQNVMHKNHIIYMDSYYTSIGMMKYLRELGIYTVGSV
jgi:hypothetical protein